MLWLRVLCGLFFVGWMAAVAYTAWVVIRPLPNPSDWRSKFGAVDPETVRQIEQAQRHGR